MTAKHPVTILAPSKAVPIIARELSRRRLFGVAGGVGATAFLAACSSTGAGSAPTATGGALESDLSIYTWGDYDAPDVISAFTSGEGPQITLDSYSSNEELLSKLTASKGTSGYDIVVPTGIFVPGMIENGLLTKLSKDLIPNLSKVDPQFLGQAWDPDNEYTVCKNWGTTGFAYDTSVITRELVTWADFLDAVQNEGSGRTSFLDDPIEIVAPYFWANGIDYTTESEDDYAAAEAFMVDSIAPHIAAFESYPGGSIIPQNTQVLVQSWNGDARLGKLNSEDPERWKWVLGSPTTELWMDNWAIAAGAPHPEAAHAFIDYVLDPANAIQELDYIGYNTGTLDIEALARDAQLEFLDGYIFYPEETVSTMQTGTVTNQMTLDVYNKVKAAAGA
ncbi:spermidine/putrescine transport system substrate-binding protein [Rathayibacter oskolensis]|uniref:Spermidine/putrescine transport system substrate-binding protein n=1 Tax=Rathayibacter oskolensis TaxID=1891671 RepID=A0A1X7MZZ5_9MICO|nr:spermidine/putrescine ABC transporter substrate-binding protein [Rathayibacter oskolensis]SMH29630.1 spermidine/putrescine transport system substrate-binding protein [Rathayibacter oskolensis]